MRSLIFICSFLYISFYATSQDFSNKGTEFWTGYGYHQAMVGSSNSQDMVLYFTSDQAATVKVEIPGVGWTKTYQVAANAVTESDPMPKSGSQDARLVTEGSYNTGIHITSDNPVVAYAHIYSSSNSGASLLFPVNTLGEDYYSLNFTQKANTYASNSWAFVIATEDNTMVEITPSGKTLTHDAGVPFTVTLNKGEIFNIMGETNDIGNDYTGVDMTGTRIRSVSTGTQACKRIAVFSGSGRVSINCENAVTSSDNLFQQSFPQSAWGKKFLTVPTDNLPNNYFRIAVSDPATVVTVDGAPLSNLINNFYYEITAKTPKSIVADKPVMVAQYITSSNDDVTSPCGNSFNYDGDPEMIYLSPVEQTIDKITLNSTSHYQITSHYINVVIKTSAVKSFTLDGKDSSAVFKAFPNDPVYSYAVFHVIQGAHNLHADSGFNAIAYGYGTKESYGYNAGTNIKNLNEFITVQNPYAVSNNTCSNTPFSLFVTLPYQPSSLVWDFGNNPNLTPSQNITENNPVADSTYTSSGTTLYVYKLKTSFNFSAPGNFSVKIIANNQSSDGCAGQQEIDYTINVVAPPVANFSINHKGCATDSTRFLDASNGNGTPITKWNWDFGDGTIDSVIDPLKYYKDAGTYNVRLRSINNIGCYADTSKVLILAPPPTAKFGFSAQTCVNNAVTFTDTSTASSGTIAKWYWNFGNGDSIVNTSNAPVTYTYKSTGIYNAGLQVENAEGCKSAVFTQVINVHPTPVVNFDMPGVCVPSTAQFTNLSTISDGTDASLSFLWSFGDGGTSIDKNPAHPYQTGGTTTVTLKVTSLFGCSKDSAKIFTNIYPKPAAGFITGSADFCISDSVRFTDTSKATNSSVNTWFWDFGDHTTSNLQNPVKKYLADGAYVVTLYIKSAAGCVSDTFQKTITINKLPTAAFNVAASGCEKQAVAITDNSMANSGIINNWSWIFGDGTAAIYQNGNTFLKAFTSAGTYIIKLAVLTDKGCKSDTAKQTITIVPSPVSGFILPKICVNDDFATFTDSSYIPGSSGNEPLNYSWNFGDQNATATNPNTSTDKNPKHHFSAPGFYNVSLTTTSGAGCTSTITKSFSVNGIPLADFTISNGTSVCSNSQVQIQNNSIVSPGSITKIEITWDADNSPATIVTDENPVAGKIYSYTYPSTQTAKVYTIKMKAFSGISCFNEKTAVITIQPSPKVVFSAVPAVCLTNSNFQITQATETTGLQGTFAFSGNGVSTDGIFSPAAAGAGESTIRYTFTSNNGCRDSAEQTIKVVKNPTVQLPEKVYVLEGGSIELQPAITGSVTKYEWSPATWLNNASIQTPRSTPTADITYKLTVSSAEGCTGSGNVKVIFLITPVIPNAFSPNGDGINDVWNIPSLQSFENSTVQVFNRYGKLVFNSIGYSKAWDGRYNGSILPVGVYYYIINTGNGKRPFAGSLTILK